MGFVAFEALPADCAGGNQEVRRSAAARLWFSERSPSERLGASGRAAAARIPLAVGRVDAAGAFQDAAITGELIEALPREFGPALNPEMDWYACRGAHFHNDAHFDGVLFGVWCVAGPNRELVFPRVARRFPARVGSIAVFDPFEPHGVLLPGADRYRRADYEASDLSVFLGFELRLTTAIREHFGITAGGCGATGILSSRIPVHAETGALASRR